MLDIRAIYKKKYGESLYSTIQASYACTHTHAHIFSLSDRNLSMAFVHIFRKTLTEIIRRPCYTCVVVMIRNSSYFVLIHVSLKALAH